MEKLDKKELLSIINDALKLAIEKGYLDRRPVIKAFAVFIEKLIKDGK